ncbi:DgyrCDS9843 [Dimorphilus gyrociliatus]|uniref:DgyrCDS9843 n=1 Tax=Dimorphilus gyrociliatus TaxID=2664684 RepID=A0A7I8VZL3_9ANNE|nr:DgyrCDS9843 [Dimorphilus gyrociliatus]
MSRYEDCISSDSDSDSYVSGDEEQSEATGGAGVLTLEDDEDTTLIQQNEQVLVQAMDVYGEEHEEETINETTNEKEEITEETTEDDDKPKKKKKKKKKFLYICLTSCKYDSVRRVSRRVGFKEVGEDEDWNLYWTDQSVALERVMEMKRYQKINHFPGMAEICRKDLLARNLNRMIKLFPKEYNVFPKSWCLPADYGDLQAYSRAKRHKTYILKPESGCQGKGIWVTKNTKEIKAHEHMLCQIYVSKPFLIDGFKFDLRIYVLVTSCDPFRIFVFKDGLARFATQKYLDPTHANVDNVFMHLTNYAINKNSKDFIRDDEAGSKRRITTINKWFVKNGYDIDQIWRDVDDVIIKTLVSAYGVLKHNYRTCFPNHFKSSACFEILGFDVMFDKKLRPYVLEVNHSPSFHTDAKLDKEIKEALLHDTMVLINVGAIDKKKVMEEERKKVKERLLHKGSKKATREQMDAAISSHLEQLEKFEDAHLGNFRRIYPMRGSEKYDKFFQTSGSLYQETAAFKARSEAARIQREEIKRKQEKLDSILKKKTSGRDPSELRPESPGGGARPKLLTKRLSNPGTKPVRRFTNGTVQRAENKVISNNEVLVETVPIDSSIPGAIVDDEELERISGLMQRDNLVRGLGVVEHVYRLLHATPGTSGGHYHSQNKNHSSQPRLHSVSSDDVSKRIEGTLGGGGRMLYTTHHQPLKPIQRENKNKSITDPQWRLALAPQMNDSIRLRPKGRDKDLEIHRKTSSHGSRKESGVSSNSKTPRISSGPSAPAITHSFLTAAPHVLCDSALSVVSAPAPVMMRPDQVTPPPIDAFRQKRHAIRQIDQQVIAYR